MDGEKAKNIEDYGLEKEIKVNQEMIIKGYTFIPTVSEEGIISWKNDGHLDNPEPRNIKGKDAIINGYNEINIEGGNNIDVTQVGNVIRINNTYFYDDTEVNDRITSTESDINTLKTDVSTNTNEITSVKDKLKEYSLVTETGNKIKVEVDDDYIVTISLLDKNDKLLSSGNVDLPIEQVVVDMTYDDDTKKLTIHLQNGITRGIPLSGMVDGLVNETTLNSEISKLNTAIGTKVTKEDGKGLSTNDFTNDYKGKLDSLKNYDDTSITNRVKTLEIDNTTNKSDIKTNADNIKSNTDIIKELQDNLYPTIIENQEEIQIKSNLESKMTDFKLNGAMKQDTTEGNQLLDLEKMAVNSTETILNGATYSYNKETGLLKIDTTKATDTTTIKSNNIGTNGNVILKAGTYTTNVNFNTRAISDNTFKQYGRTFTITEDVYLTQWYLPITTGKTVEIYPTLNKGTSLLAYEKYTGGVVSPNPEYPSDIRTVEGYNLIDFYDEIKSFSDSGLSYEIDKDRRISINGTSNRAWDYTLTKNVELKAGKTYTLGYEGTNDNIIFYMIAEQQQSISNKIKSVTFTVQNDVTTKLMFSLGNGGTVSSKDLGIYLIEGSETKPYLPYKSIGVKVENKNYIQPTKKSYSNAGITCIYDEETNTFTLNGTSTATADINLVEPTTMPMVKNMKKDEVFTLVSQRISGSVISPSGTPNLTCRVWENGQKYYGWRASLLVEKSYAPYTVKNDGDSIDYLRFSFNNGVIFNNLQVKIQLEKNNIPTEMVKHQEQLLPLTIGDRLLTEGNYFYKENGKWKFYQKFRKDRLTKMEGKSSNTTKISRFTTSNIPNVKNGISIDCTHFIGNSMGRWSENLVNVIYGWESGINIGLNVSAEEFPNLESINKFLEENDVEIIYELATPIIEEITDETLIKQLDDILQAKMYKEVTNVSTKVEDVKPTMSIEYYQGQMAVMYRKLDELTK